MALPNNTLQQVQLYLPSELAYLQNLCCAISTANKRFDGFENFEGNLGSSVTFDLPPRGVVKPSLVITFQSAVQRNFTLTVDQQWSYANAFNNQQFIFNVKDYMEKFGKTAIAEMGAVMEANVLQNFNSSVVNNDPNSSSQGTVNTASGPYRFFGDGVTPFNSYGQLANMLASFRNYGAPDKGILRSYMSDIAIPQIVNSGANQFTIDRNNKSVMSWMVGNWQGAEFYQSNLLPVQNAGSVGDDSRTLTVVSTNDPTGANVTQITFSDTTTTDSGSVLSGDLFEFQDGVSGQTNIRFLTFTGHQVSAQPVQFRATANAGTTASSITVSILPALCWQSGNQNQNLSTAITAGMQVKALPTHRAGCVVAADALYMAMPKLPNEEPFPTVSENDKLTGASLRHYWGSQFGQNQKGYVRDAISGSCLVPEYSMRIAFPLTQ